MASPEVSLAGLCSFSSGWTPITSLLLDVLPFVLRFQHIPKDETKSVTHKDVRYTRKNCMIFPICTDGNLENMFGDA